MSKTVLVVEDNELNMKLFHDLLEASGYDIVETRNGLEAIDLARTHRPDLILMDIQLPEVSGLEVTKWIKEDDDLRSIPIIAVTAFAMKGDEERIRQGGCEAYLSKPISVAKFIETVKVISGRRLGGSRNDCTGSGRRRPCRQHQAAGGAADGRIFRGRDGDERPGSARDLRARPVRHRASRRDDAGDERLEVCRRLKADPRTAHIPVSSSPRSTSRPTGSSGSRPAPTISSPSRSTNRSGHPGQEPGEAEDADRRIDDAGGDVERDRFRRDDGPEDDLGRGRPDSSRRGHGGQRRSRRRYPVARSTPSTSNADPQEALFTAADGDYDLAIISLSLAGIDGLRLCSQLRSLDRTRQLPILVIADPDDKQRLLRGLDLGVNDYLLRPIDRNELLARVRTQIRRKRFSDRLRDNVQMTMEMAVTDGLTGLHNRRYLERHLGALVQQAQDRSKPLSVLVARHRSFQGGQRRPRPSRRRRRAARILAAGPEGGPRHRSRLPAGRRGVRGGDAGHRFRAGAAGRRADPAEDRRRALPDGRRRHRSTITVSIGVSSLEARSDTPEMLLKRADEALYRAKRSGRNRVAAAAA